MFFYTAFLLRLAFSSILFCFVHVYLHSFHCLHMRPRLGRPFLFVSSITSFLQHEAAFLFTKAKFLLACLRCITAVCFISVRILQICTNFKEIWTQKNIHLFFLLVPETKRTIYERTNSSGIMIFFCWGGVNVCVEICFVLAMCKHRFQVNQMR